MGVRQRRRYSSATQLALFHISHLRIPPHCSTPDFTRNEIKLLETRRVSFELVKSMPIPHTHNTSWFLRLGSSCFFLPLLPSSCFFSLADGRVAVISTCRIIASSLSNNDVIFLVADGQVVRTCVRIRKQRKRLSVGRQSK